MYCVRRKYRKVLVWICLVAVGQAIFSMFLYEEFNFAPIRHGWTTKTFANEIKTRLRLQSQDVEHTEENLKFIARAKLDHSRKKEESVDFKRSILIKSASFQLSGNRKKLHHSPGEIRRSNQDNDLSARISDQERRGHKLSHHDLKHANENNAGHEFRTESSERTKNTEIKDVFISVKTTGEFHKTRVQILLDTWIQNAKNQVYLFTDQDDAKVNKSLGGHLVNTLCEAGHQRTRLCCKMQAELDFFLQLKKKTKWFCHFDDDNYVNVPALVNTLKNFNPEDDVYLGKPSLIREMEAWDRLDGNKQKKFWFATGGAGFCLSRALVNKMRPYISDGKFIESCERIKLPDDCTVGFISEVLVKAKLKRSELFHSHLESLPFLPQSEFSKQVTFSHGFMGGSYNRISIDGPFNVVDDPSRFKSVHCFLNHETTWCPKSENKDKIGDDDKLKTYR